MNKQDYKIHSVGAGIRGPIAATILEQNGYYPGIIEATDRIGGRLKTDIVDGYQRNSQFPGYFHEWRQYFPNHATVKLKTQWFIHIL